MFLSKETRSTNGHKIVVTLTIILLLSVVPIVITGLFSRPCADDYSYAIDTYHLIKSGDWNIFTLLKTAFDVDIYFYNNWQGLYSSAFILALQPGIFGEKYYFFGAWILMSLLLFSVYYLVLQMTNAIGGIRKRYVAFLSLLVFAVLMQGMPSLVQGIYWFNGAWNYTFFFCMVLINVGLIISYVCKSYKNRYLMFATVFSFIISGGNHVTAFLNIMILAISSLLLFQKKKVILLPFLTAVIGFILMYCAPGTAIRQSGELSQGVISTLIHSIWGCFYYLCEWMNIQWICFLILLVPVAVYVVHFCSIDICKLKMHPFFLVVITLVLICGMLCVPYIAMGNFGKERITNVIWFTFIICTAINWIYLLMWSKIVLVIEQIEFKKIYSWGLIVVCWVCVFFYSSNSLLTIEELLSGRAVEYAEACEARYRLMRENEENEVIYVDKLPNSEVLNFSDLTSDVTNWQNSSWKAYYGVDMLVNEDK